MKKSVSRTALWAIMVLTAASVFAQKRKITFEDVMKFKQIKNPVISSKGSYIGFTARPDRGNPYAVVQRVSDKAVLFDFERGSGVVFSKDEKWAAFKLNPDFAKVEKAKKKKPKSGLAVINLDEPDTLIYNEVSAFEFSPDSKFLFIKKHGDEKLTKKNYGSPLIIKELSEGEDTLSFVTAFAVDSTSTFLTAAVADTILKNNNISNLNLSDGLKAIIVDADSSARFTNLRWHKNGSLAYFKSKFSEKLKNGRANLKIWNGSAANVIAASADAETGWHIPAVNRLFWTENGERLFFGYRPDRYLDTEDEDTADVDIYDFETILSKKEADVWHPDDPMIKPNEKKQWKRTKAKTYTAVYHFGNGKIVRLADEEMPDIAYTENDAFALGSSSVPYMKERTWDGWYADYYVVNLNTGLRERFIEHLGSRAYLSPDGKFAVYYNNKNWFLYDVKSTETKNLTNKIQIPFYNEDHDYPAAVPGYGVAGWLENDEAVLIYDKFDIWKFDTHSGEAEMITLGEGRESKFQFRVTKTDSKKRFFKSDEKLLLRAYNDEGKQTSYFSVSAEGGVPAELIGGEKKFTFVAKAEKSDDFLYTCESYSEFPDLWVSDEWFDSPEKISDLGKQTDHFLWGRAELIHYKDARDVDLDAIVIYPENFERQKKYPVFIYYYRFFTPRLYNFPDVVINHRPNFPVYSSDDYIILMPDIRFVVGRPGAAAVRCLTAAVEKVIDMGIADPNAIGLHGHSWSGYQTAFAVTQTDIFTAAVSGAPVSNMTSAYSGIRWGTGLARQFQYEKTQSRIGKTLWNGLDDYIANSPVFFADKINTPMLIMHGDADDAVPWYQSIELYLAGRRLGKDIIFLQYRNEPHHPKKYANKLDYSIKMKEYFDHYLKGAPAPDWMTKGEPYMGK